MRHRRPIGLALAGAAACATALAGCANPATTSTARGPAVVDSMVVLSQDVSPAPERTYEYDLSEVRPDSVLLDLWRSGLDVEVAWLPLDYRCDDPLGARLTVELTAADARMAQHDFRLGTGRLMCAVHLMQYTVASADVRG